MIPRPHHIIEKDGIETGYVTSGCFSPILGKNIGLGYIKIENTNIGNQFQINARGRKTSAEIIKTPFVLSLINYQKALHNCGVFFDL